MTDTNLIGTRHLESSGRSIPVQLFRNSGGSIAGRLELGEGDTPIVDGASESDVLALLGDLLESLLLARVALKVS